MKDVRRFIVSELVIPFIHRIASVIAVFLSAHGVAEGHVTEMSACILSVSGLLVDFLVRKVIY